MEAPQYLLQLLQQAGVQVPNSVAKQSSDTLVNFIERELAKKAQHAENQELSHGQAVLEPPAISRHTSSSSDNDSSQGRAINIHQNDHKLLLVDMKLVLDIFFYRFFMLELQQCAGAKCG